MASIEGPGGERILACLADAEAALAPLVQMMQDHDDLDRRAVAELLESIGSLRERGTILAFAWALVRMLKEQWQQDAD